MITMELGKISDSQPSINRDMINLVGACRSLSCPSHCNLRIIHTFGATLVAED